MTELLANIAGISGVVLVLLAYFLISAEKVTGQSLLYHLLNLVGAILILISLMVFWNLASFIIEVVWIAISLYGIAKIIHRNRKQTRR
tara:strand:+ start:301 stop:564 length:264 start_codon:yes stop_codon:yes gene_type:complete